MKEAERMASSISRFRSLFENTPEIIIYQNEDSTILDANPSFLELVGEPREHVINRNFDDFLPVQVRSYFKEKLREAFKGNIGRFEMYFAYKNSTAVHWDVVKIPLIKNKKVIGVHMIARDITEKVEAQERIFDQNKDLQQFTYMVAHNLRGPLSNAIGLIDVLGEIQPDTPIFESTYAYAKSSLQQLDQVLKDMNMILSIRNKDALSKQEYVSLLEVVNQVISNFQDDINKYNGIVEVLIPDGFLVGTNRAYLYSIFFNLFSNAIKYHSECRPLRIILTATEISGQDKIITISDNGLGIDLVKAGENMFKLYKRFHPQHSAAAWACILSKRILRVLVEILA